MIKHFNLNILEKESNRINKKSYLNLKYKNRDESFVAEQKKRIEYNFDLNMKYFDSLEKESFDKYLLDFVKRNKFIEVTDLSKYEGIKGVYIMVLDNYKQVYIGLSESGIKERIKKHWNNTPASERLIFGRAFNSKLSIDSFGALDTTRIFVNPTRILYLTENKFVDEFDDKYILNRTGGGIGSIDTYTDCELSAQVSAIANGKRRDFSAFIDEEELYAKCNSLDIRDYELEKRQ